MATDNKRIAKNTLFLYFRMFLVMAVSLCTAGVTLRVLGEVDYGLNAVLGGIVAMFSFLNGALGGAASRFITFELGTGNVKRLNQIFNASLLVFVGLGLLIVVLSETVGLWFFHNKMTIPDERMTAAFWVFQISIVTCPIQLTQVPYNATIIAHEDMKIYAYVSMADVVIKLLFVYLLIVSPFDKLITLSTLWFVWGGVRVLFYRVYCIARYKETRLCLCKDWKLYKEIFSYAGSDLIGNVSVLAQGHGINLLLNVFFGPAINAARGIAYAIQGMISQFSNNFMIAVRPQIIKSYAQGDYSSMWKLVVRSSCFSFYLMLFVALPVCIEADTLLSIWLGSYPAHTLTFLYLVVVLCLIQTIYNPRVAVFHASGHIFWGNVIMGTILCGAFPLAYIFLKVGFAPEAAIAACIISMMLADFAALFVLRHYVQFNISKYYISVHVRCLLVGVLSSIIPLGVCSRLMPACFARCFLTGLVTTICIGTVAFFVGMDANMRRTVIDFTSSKLRMFIKR